MNFADMLMSGMKAGGLWMVAMVGAHLAVLLMVAVKKSDRK